MPLPLVGGVLTWAIIVPLVVKVLLALGIGIVTYTGADFAISNAETYIYGEYDGLPSNVWAIMTLSGFHEGLKILFAGFSAQIGIKTAMGSFKKFAFTG